MENKAPRGRPCLCLLQSFLLPSPLASLPVLSGPFCLESPLPSSTSGQSWATPLRLKDRSGLTFGQMIPLSRGQCEAGWGLGLVRRGSQYVHNAHL